MGGFAGVAPDSVGLCADDALGVGDAPGELSSAPVAGLDYCAHSLLGVSPENVVLYSTENSLNVSDIAATGNGGVVVDYANTPNNVIHIALLIGDDATITLRSGITPRSVSFNGVDLGPVGRAGSDSNVVGLSVSLPVEGD